MCYDETHQIGESLRDATAPADDRTATAAADDRTATAAADDRTATTVFPPGDDGASASADAMESPPATDSGGPSVSERERQFVGRGATASGVTPAVVTDNEDPEGMGRVKLRIPRREGDDESDWARIAVPMAGGDRGTYFLPEVGDEVLVAFDTSDPGEPYVVGALWNGEDAPPAENEGNNDVRLIRSRSGHEIELDDASDGGLRIETAGGHTVVLDDGGGTVTIEDGNGTNSVTFESGGLTLSSSTAVSVEAPQIDITSDGNLTVEAGGVLTLNGTLVTIN